MEDFGYWIFLLILYLLSAVLKKRKQKAAYRKMEEVEEENDWKAPDFIKELFSDFTESEEIKEEIVPDPFLEETHHDPEVESSVQYDDDIPIEPSREIQKELSSIDDRRQIGTIKHEFRKKERIKTSFFKKQQDVKMAIIYKEILDKPRALRKQFR